MKKVHVMQWLIQEHLYSTCTLISKSAADLILICNYTRYAC